MFHTEIPPCAQRKTGDGRLGAKKALVVAVIGYAVCAGSVVIHQAKIVFCACRLLCDLAELVKAGSYGSRLAWTIAVGQDGFLGDRVYKGAGGSEE